MKNVSPYHASDILLPHDKIKDVYIWDGIRGKVSTYVNDHLYDIVMPAMENLGIETEARVREDLRKLG